MSFAVVTVVLTGTDASQRGTSADATDGMASMAIAKKPMINLRI